VYLKINKLKNQKGSALLPVLSVFFILILIFTSVVMYGAWHRLRARLTLQKLKASYLAEAGVNRALWLLSGQEQKDLNFRTEGYLQKIDDLQSYQFKIRNWGGYLLVESEGKAGRVKKSVKALIGQKQTEEFNRAINLGSPDYPLILAGRTRIKGDVLLSLAGVMEGKFKGEGFSGDTLVDGKISTQKGNRLPIFNTDLTIEFEENVKQLKETTDYRIDKSLTLDEKVEPDYLKAKTTYINGSILINASKEKTFKGPGFLYCTGKIEITGESRLEDRFIFVSEKTIEVSGKALLKDCILYSKKQVILKDDVVFEGQIFSDSNIVMEDKAKTIFPSFLLLTGKKVKDRIEGKIEIKSKESEGILAFQEWDIQRAAFFIKNNGIITISPEAVFKGMIYSSNYTDLEGVLHGNVSTNMFYFYSEPTTYIDWLKDAVVNRYELKKEIVLPLVFGKNHKLEIARYEEID
jgi:hypothetical protein